MRVIDVDSHFLEPPSWLSRVDPQLADQIPPHDPIERIVQFVVGDLLEAIPRSQRPDNLLELLAPSGRRATEAMLEKNATERDADPAIAPPSSYDAAARVAFCDDHGLDVQFLNPTLGSNPYAAAMRKGRPDLARRALECFNTWSGETLAGYTDRLIPVAMIDVSDVDWAVREITRMRAAGSRAFQVRAEPVSETKSLAHPDMDPLWAAAADLGMAVVFHIGAGRGEVKKGWFFNGGDASNFAILHLINGSIVPQIALAAMLIEGVFQRHPGLVVMVQELGITWLPHFLTSIDSVTVGAYGAHFGMGPGDYKLPLKPSEYMRRQVRVTPLVSADPLRPTLDLVPRELLVFSSDFPHPEGRGGAIPLFEDQMQDLDAEARASFFGGSISDLLGL